MLQGDFRGGGSGDPRQRDELARQWHGNVERRGYRRLNFRCKGSKTFVVNAFQGEAGEIALSQLALQ
jgi:hypothetical protein